MQPFQSIAELTRWFAALPVQSEMSVLLDFRDIGIGLQRREIQNRNGNWVIGFGSLGVLI